MAVIKQSTARNRTFLLISSADHLTGLTGITWPPTGGATGSIQISKNGAAFAAPSGTVTEIGFGWYNIALTTTDTNTLGDLNYHVTATGADPMDEQDEVSVIDFSDPVRMGLTALPNAAAGGNGGLPTIGGQIPNAVAGASNGLVVNGTNAGATFTGGITSNLTGNVSGSVATVGTVTGDVAGKVLGGGSSSFSANGVQAALSQATADLVWQSTRYTQESGTAQGGTSNTITLRSGATSADNWFIGNLLQIVSGTGAGQARVIIGYTGSSKIATVDQNWITNPDSTSVYAIALADLPATYPQQNVGCDHVSHDVQGNVSGSVLTNVVGRVLGNSATNFVGIGAQTDVRSWNGTTVSAPNTPGVPKVDVAEWVGGVPNNLISGLVPVNTQNTASTLTYNLSGNVTGSVGNVTGAVGSVSAGVTVATNNDKTGYALSAGEHTNISGDVLNANAASFNNSGSIGNKINSAATAGDPWQAFLPGTYGPGTAGAIVGNRLDAQVSTRLAAGNVTVGGYASGQDPATLVLDVTATLHNTAGTMGAKINSAASAGDPWSTSLPGSYSPGQAGNIIGNRLDANVTSRMATFTLPTNFATLSVDSSGRIFVAPLGLDAVQVEPGVNARQALVVMAAAEGGVLSGATGTNINIQGANNPNVNRIAAVVDASGDRTSVTLNLP